MSDRRERLGEFKKIPRWARMDHRLMLDENGRHRLISLLPRNERRKLKQEGEKLANKYRSIIKDVLSGGAKFPIDTLLRAMVVEYIHRFASSGTDNQPTSFNYFEPFCWPKIIPNSFAPYLEIKEEYDHLFELSDFFDFATSIDIDLANVSHLVELPQHSIFHFTTNGDIFETTIFDVEKREFVVSGFSMVRISSSIYWYALVGEIFAPDEWDQILSWDVSESIKLAPPWKRKFLQDMLKRTGSNSGRPLALEGTERAWRTVVAGEFDFVNRKHLTRFFFSETEHAFRGFSDDPEIYEGIPGWQRDGVFAAALEKMSVARPIWNLVEAFFHLPRYFESRIPAPPEFQSEIQRGGKKGRKGAVAKYKYVRSIEPSSALLGLAIMEVKLPHFAVEVDGHWRRLPSGSEGRDALGNPVTGKTWVRRRSGWRKNDADDRPIFVKDTLASARVSLQNLISASKAAEIEQADVSSDDNLTQELYVMRCPTMQEEIYKVGWTRGSSVDRAKELSSATGVASAFIVANYWKLSNAEEVEADVHAALAPFRVDNNREFFRCGSDFIKRTIEQSIDRSKKV